MAALFVAIIDTVRLSANTILMANRQTLNVSLPPSQDHFVRTQVSSGRYRTASEVVREGLRLLEEAEHRRLLEKWIVGDLSQEESEALPQELKDRARAHFSALIEESVRSGDEEGWIDGDSAMQQLGTRLRKRFPKNA